MLFAHRLKSYKIFQFILLFYVSSGAIVGQTPTKCAAINEYCLNHSDCCSNSCMIYLYRCTPGNNTYPYSFLDVSYKPNVTFDQIMHQYFGNRFGGAENIVTTGVKTIQQKSKETANKEASTLKYSDDLQEDSILGQQEINNAANETPSDREHLETATNKKLCAESGGKCLNHWDCCSNSCMSYLYRCTRGNNAYPYPFLGVSYKPSVTLDQILDQNFGISNGIPNYEHKPYFVSRFGSADDDTDVDIDTQEKIVTPKSKETTSNEATTLTNPAVLHETSTVWQQQLDDVANDTQTNFERTTDREPCAEIGEKCYRHEECCTKRCHGYLHKCVT